jgi:sialic acid synthase SpsE
MIKPVKIKDKIIGNGYPTFFIAEMACAHQGELQQACNLVEVAAKANADAVQLQIINRELYCSPLYKDYDEYGQLEFSPEEWSKIIDKIKENDLLFFAAAYDVSSIKLSIDKGVDAFKIHSADLSNPELLNAVGKTKKPVFLSTGASRIDEIIKAMDILKKNGTEDIVLMHGYQGFPTKIEDSHLNFLKTLKRIFRLNIGFYDHVDGGSILAMIIPMMAIGYNAQVIEKHYILTRENKGIDYESSLDKETFIEFGKSLRECEKAIGSQKIRDFTDGEIWYREYCKKNIVAWQDIPKGTKITQESVRFLRSDPGILPDKFEEIEGRIAKKDIKKYNILTYDDFD